MTAINQFGNVGYVKAGHYTYSFQIGEHPAMGLNSSPADVAQAQGMKAISLIKMQKYNIYPYGENNLEPNEVKELISTNRLLPELIEKQVRMLYGLNPILYVEQREGKNVWREFVTNEQIQAWLDSWLDIGLQDDYKTYLNKCIRSYYYDEGILSKWRLAKSHRIGGALPVAGLEHLSSLRGRFATAANIPVQRTDFEDKDFDLVLVGNWLQYNSNEFKVYHRFSYAKPFAAPITVSYSKNPSHGEEIYAFNTFYRGIKDWIKGSNLTPKYINNYLENALSARLHIIIPNAWVDSKRKMLESMCEKNVELKAAGKELLVIKFGENDILDVGTDYNENILNQFTQKELARLTQFLSGAGKNQGKLYASFSFIGDSGKEERWKIEEIPQKYKEYIEGLTNYDKRADEVMLSAKGIDSSISNVSKDGVISKSGADAYYNYIIYLAGLAIPEEVVCRDINFAIKLNFPEAYKTGIRLGFYRSAVARQQEVSPADRPANNQQV